MIPRVPKGHFDEQIRPLLNKLEAEFGVELHYVVYNTDQGIWLDLDIVFPLFRYCYNELDRVGDEIYVRLCAWITDYEASIGASSPSPWWDRGKLDVSTDHLF